MKLNKSRKDYLHPTVLTGISAACTALGMALGKDDEWGRYALLIAALFAIFGIVVQSPNTKVKNVKTNKPAK